MNQFPLVSILIPTYNQTYYLKEALESAVSQTYSNIEIIISDDSSNDEVEKFLQPYLESYSNIYYLKNERSEMDYGVTNCLNLFSKCRGEYVNFLFHDDIFHVSKIERMMKYFMANPRINLVTSYRHLVDKEGQILPDENATKRLSTSDVVVEGRKLGMLCLVNLLNFIGEPTTVLFKKEALKEGVFRFNGKLYSGLADVATWLSLLKNGEAAYLCDSLSFFRRHKEQNTVKPSVHIMGIVEWKEILDDAYQTGYFNKEQHKQMIEKWFFSFNYILRINNFSKIDSTLANRLQTVFKEAIDIISLKNKDELNILTGNGFDGGHKCKFCGATVSGFLPWSGRTSEYVKQFDIIGSDIDHFLCARCGSTDRSRHLLMYFERLNIWKNFIEGKNVLHIAPEVHLQHIINNFMKCEEYVCGDLFPDATKNIVKIDITNIHYQDNHFDFIICNHVLEHIIDDIKAMSEILRVLKNGGTAVLQTPYSERLDRSFEDSTILSEEDREENFGQADHVRVYGRDFFERLVQVGFLIDIKRNNDLFTVEECRYYGVNYRENLILVHKK